VTTTDIINYLSIVVLVGFVVALVFLILLLYRANRLANKLDHLTDTFRSFVSDIVPAIVNFGTIATAVESILRTLHQEKAAKVVHDVSKANQEK
jgi:peptidoglycan biosynthesis protein MviN/MurJ (putative lipid II flippase)